MAQTTTSSNLSSAEARQHALRLVFAMLDPTSLFAAANVCEEWHRIASGVCKADRFRTVLADVLARPATLDWAVNETGAMPQALRAEACNIAAKHGHLSGLQWLRSRAYPWDKRVCANAALGGHLELLQWAFFLGQINRVDFRTNDCPWDSWVSAHAAYGGHLELLRWARAAGCPWDEGATANAAEGGHLETLDWLRENGCPWNVWTTTCAASSSQLKALQWARNNGCPWNGDVCVWAVMNGQLELLQWARANGCPWDRARCLDRARKYRKPTLVAWIESQAD